MRTNRKLVKNTKAQASSGKKYSEQPLREKLLT